MTAFLLRRTPILLPLAACLLMAGCNTLQPNQLPKGVKLPAAFTNTADTTAPTLHAGEFFADPYLSALIDTALANNYNLKMALQRVEIARANTGIATAARRPVVNAAAGILLDRYGKYTMNGVGNFDTNLSPNISKNQTIPNPTPDYFAGFRSSWEADIWGKLQDRKKAALTRYLASQTGRKWLTTQIIAEVARLYYELLALDYQLKIVTSNIAVQKRGLEIVEAQMAGGRATALAVRQFKAQLLHTRGAEAEIQQSIAAAENTLNSLLGRFSATIQRDSVLLEKPIPQRIRAGVPGNVLLGRPDIQTAELELMATKADVSAARKALLPSLSLNAYLGLNAFKLPLLLSAGSIAAGVASGFAAPIINRKALEEGVHIANAEQLNAFYRYQENIVQGYNEVMTQLQSLQYQNKAYNLKTEQVSTLQEAVATANDLYLAGYATYLEVVVAQGSVLQAELEQASLKQQMFNTLINLYRALGGGE